MATTDDAAQLVTLAQKVAADATSDAAALAGAMDSNKQLGAQLTAAQATIAAQAAEIATLKNPPTPAPTPVPTGRKLLWEDRFTTLDKTRWNVRQEAEGGTRQGYDLPANVTIQPDGLHISVKRQSYGGKAYTTGGIDTNGKFSMTTGRWEWDFVLPTFPGAWPALWLRCDSTLGELDALETVGGVPHMIVMTAHESTNGLATDDRAGFDYEDPNFNPRAKHTLALERDADGTVRWYLDGQLKHTVKPTDVSTKLHKVMSWLNGPNYQSPLHIIINVQVGGGMPIYYNQDPAKATAFDDFIISAVRVYS